MTDVEREDILKDVAGMKKDVSYIKEAIDKIWPFCTQVTQHEEQIGSLQMSVRALAWVGGIVLSLLIGATIGQVFMG